MQSISLCDSVSLKTVSGGGISLECDSESIPSGKDNIAYRAAEAFFGYSGIQNQGISIKIKKNIPSQAGLGGGSADAAAVLCGLNRLFETGYSEDELCRIGVKVGADVPFCIMGGTRLCEGIGELFSEVPVLEDCHIVIGKGPDGISTKEAFEKIDLLGFSGDKISEGYDGTIKSVSEIGRNIFEEVSDLKSVSEIKNVLLSGGAEYAAMSGSGSAVFGVFRDIHAAAVSARIISEKGYFTFLCKPIGYGVNFISNHH